MGQTQGSRSHQSWVGPWSQEGHRPWDLQCSQPAAQPELNGARHSQPQLWGASCQQSEGWVATSPAETASPRPLVTFSAIVTLRGQVAESPGFSHSILRVGVPQRARDPGAQFQAQVIYCERVFA